MKTYTFNVVVEPDEDRWHAYCPALHQQGAATWGNTRQEALKNIEDVVRGEVEVTVEPRVAISV
jgi:predicted RNase H-like HicB family nuclease